MNLIIYLVFGARISFAEKSYKSERSCIKFFGAAGTNDVYENFIIFEQSTVNNMIRNSNIELISW